MGNTFSLKSYYDAFTNKLYFYCDDSRFPIYLAELEIILTILIATANLHWHI